MALHATFCGNNNNNTMRLFDTSLIVIMQLMLSDMHIIALYTVVACHKNLQQRQVLVKTVICVAPLYNMYKNYKVREWLEHGKTTTKLQQQQTGNLQKPQQRPKIICGNIILTYMYLYTLA